MRTLPAALLLATSTACVSPATSTDITETSIAIFRAEVDARLNDLEDGTIDREQLDLALDLAEQDAADAAGQAAATAAADSVAHLPTSMPELILSLLGVVTAAAGASVPVVNRVRDANRLRRGEPVGKNTSEG